MAKGDFDFLEDPDNLGSGEGKNKEGEDGKDLLAGKYKTPEELANAYKELEGTFTKTSQERAELDRQLKDLQQRVTLQQQQMAGLQDKGKDEGDDEDAFWKDPLETMDSRVQKQVQQSLDPIVTGYYEMQKAALRSDPLFQKYEAEIDAVISQAPQMKGKPGIVNEVFRMVKGLHIEEILEQHTKDVLEGKQSSVLGKIQANLEGGSPSQGIRGEKATALTKEEERVAIKMNPELSREDAIKRYSTNKVKWGGV